MTRRGLTLVELLVALAVTTLVAAGVSSLLAGLGAGLAAGADTRTAMLASASTHRRLVEATSSMHAVLDARDDITLLWFGDRTPGGEVELSEVAWLVLDRDRGTLSLETVVVDDDMDGLERALFDETLPPAMDSAAMLARLRGRELIDRTVIADGLLEGGFTPREDRSGLAIEVVFDLETGPASWSSLLRFGGQPPLEWRP